MSRSAAAARVVSVETLLNLVSQGAELRICRSQSIARFACSGAVDNRTPAVTEFQLCLTLTCSIPFASNIATRALQKASATDAAWLWLTNINN
jgi:hypothetical protein